MIIKEADYLGSYVDMHQLPGGDGPEIALLGRSNVGKSSLINNITQRKKLAKSSSTPGKTRTINFYHINKSWYFVDLPGYGYAKVSKQERMRWGKMIETYLEKRTLIKGVILLIDIRHPPQENDKEMKNWLEYHNLPYLVVATKADKISRSARGKHMYAVKKELLLNPDYEPICFSAFTGEGAGEIKLALEELINDKK